LGFSAFIPIDILLQNPTEKLVAAEAVALATSVISLFITIIQYYIIFHKYGTLGYCQMARDTQHNSAEPILNYD
jgi:cell division protein FtsB